MKECFKRDDDIPLEIPAFIVTTNHPNTWKSQPKNCVRVNRGMINLLLKKSKDENLHVFCCEGTFKKAHQHVLEERLKSRIKSVWKEAKGLVGVSISLSG